MLVLTESLYAAVTWAPPPPIEAEPSVDPTTGRVYVTMELGHIRRKVRVPMLCPTTLIHACLYDHALEVLRDAAKPMTPLEMAGQAFETNVAGMGGRNGTR